MSYLVPPHGGKLLPLLVHDDELKDSIKEAETLPKVRLDSRKVSDLIMLIASSIGIQFGVLVTRYVRGVSVRFVLGISILIAALGAILKLPNTLLGKTATGLEIGSLVVTFSGMGLAVVMILTLFIMAVRYRRGHHVPVWIRSLVARET